ncbi:hypothetical protein B0H21DRAFT_893032 [Amylocystis lapponica]|nr:hypothetical protein B0H21DRAFT_893032 [Amylocystis lapponica]
MSSNSRWTYATLDTVSQIPDHVLSSCSDHIHYLQDLKRSWDVLRVPQFYLDYEPFQLNIWNSWRFNAILVQSLLKLIESDLTIISDAELSAQSPFDLVPNFRLSTERHRPGVKYEYQDTQWSSSFMTFCQVSQILRYQDHEAVAECTIATALEGLPSAYVRRENLAVQFDGVASNSLADDLDCALLYTPIAPTKPYSFERLRNVPINPLNPALVLCMKGPARWVDDSSPPRDLPTILHSLSDTATGSLVSLMTAWSATRRQQASLPRWATLIGIIYDSETIHFVAHIPYFAPDHTEPQFLSVLFDTLPFPASGESAECLRHRYRVALAMLCIQHHVLRVISIWEGTEWQLFQGGSQAQEEPHTPTPSEPDSDDVILSGVYAESDNSCSDVAPRFYETEVVRCWLDNVGLEV